MNQMDNVIKIVTQIVMLGMLGGIGFICGKTKYLPGDLGVGLSKLVIKLTAPILIVTTFASYSFTGSDLKNGITLYIGGIIFILGSYIISKIVSSKLNLSEVTKNIYKMHSMFGNVVFLAYPLILSLFGEKGIIYAIFYNLANDTVLWTLGIYLVRTNDKSEHKDKFGHMLNGNTFAFIFGIILMMFNFIIERFDLVHKFNYIIQYQNLGTFLFNTLNPLGRTTIYLSMVFIGLILSEVNTKDMFKRHAIYILSFFKLIFVPITAFLILGLLANWVDPFVKKILVLQLAMPCATIVPALALTYDSDYKFATESVFLSTSFGIVTLPFMIYILN